MIQYKNIAGDSGIKAFEISEHSITVQFTTGATYLYTYSSAGKKHIEKMKKLALAGKGLSTFISQNVKDNYDSIIE